MMPSKTKTLGEGAWVLSNIWVCTWVTEDTVYDIWLPERPTLTTVASFSANRSLHSYRRVLQESTVVTTSTRYERH